MNDVEEKIVNLVESISPWDFKGDPSIGNPIFNIPGNNLLELVYSTYNKSTSFD